MLELELGLGWWLGWREASGMGWWFRLERGLGLGWWFRLERGLGLGWCGQEGKTGSAVGSDQNIKRFVLTRDG